MSPVAGRQPYTFDRVVRMLIALLLILGSVWVINLLREVLLPFVISCLIAYLFEPFVQFNRRLLKLKGRVAAVFITIFEMIMLLAMVTYLIAPVILGEIKEMSRILSNYASSKITVSFLPAEFQHMLRQSIDPAKVNKILADLDWMQIGSNALKATWNIISGGWAVVLGIVSWIIVVLYVIFIMIDYDRLANGFISLVPRKMQSTSRQIIKDIETNMNRYFRGQMLIAFIVGVLFAVGFSIIGLPMAIILGLFIGLLNLVPYLQVISIVPTAFLCLVYAVDGGGDFWALFWQCVAVYAVVQCIQDFFLTPKIMGKAMGLNPAIILLALSVWGTLLGFIGLIIALPLTTLLISYYRHYILAGIDRRSDGMPGATPGDLKTFDEFTENPLK